MPGRPRLQEVAQLAGVSLATVSRVLNSKPGVAAETRSRVLDVLADLGYDELPARTEHSGVVGIVTPELVNPIFALMAQTIEARLAGTSLLAMVCPATSDTVNEQEYLDHFRRTGAAGVVVINGRYSGPMGGFAPYRALIDAGIPTVLVNGSDRTDGVPLVTVDLAAGVRSAVQHLVSMGHRRIGLLTGPRRYRTHHIQVGAFRAVMHHDASDSLEAHVSETLFTTEGGKAGVAPLLEAGVTAIIASSDLMAIGAIEGIRAWGLSVPADISVVGFDGTSISRLTEPSLTTLRQPVERMAGTITKLLGSEQRDEIHSFEPDLLVGRSTGPAPEHRSRAVGEDADATTTPLETF